MYSAVHLAAESPTRPLYQASKINDIGLTKKQWQKIDNVTNYS